MGKLFFCCRHYSYLWVSLNKVALCLLPNGEIIRILRQLFHCAEYRVMTVGNKVKLPRAAESFDPIAEKTQFQKNSYARELRAVGQALEAQHMFSLDLELNGGLYVVRGKATAADYAQSSFSGFIQDFVSGVGSVLTGGPRPSIYEIDLSYQPEDIEELDSKGRSHRRNKDRNPDPYGLAQKLRGGRLVFGLSARNHPYRNIG